MSACPRKTCSQKSTEGRNVKLAELSIGPNDKARPRGLLVMSQASYRAALLRHEWRAAGLSLVTSHPFGHQNVLRQTVLFQRGAD